MSNRSNPHTAPWEPSKRRLLQDPETRAAYEALEARDQLTRRLILMRADAGLTQAQVAGRMGITQGRIAQMESLNAPSLPSLTSLRRFAAACAHQVTIEFHPIPSRRAAPKPSRKVAEPSRTRYTAKRRP